MSAWTFLGLAVIFTLSCLAISVLLVSWRAGEGGEAELALVKLAEVFDFLAKLGGAVCTIALMIAVLRP